MNSAVHRVVASLLFVLLLANCGGTPPAASDTSASNNASSSSNATQAPAASSNSDSTQATTAPAADNSSSGGAKEKVTLSMWSQDALYVQFFGDRAKEWAKKYPQYDFTFDFQQLPASDIQTKLLNNLAAGQPVPDLIAMEQGIFPNFMKDDIVEQAFLDLTDKIKNERDEFVEARWALYQSKGKVYGVESGLSTVVYYYQPEIFEKAGIQMPLKTWDDFVAAGKKLAAQGIAMAPAYSDSNYLFNMLYYQHGGEIWDKDGNFKMDDPKNRDIAIKTLNFLNQAMKDKVFFNTGFGDFWGQPMYNAYQEGKVAGAIMPEWYSDQMLKTQVKGMSGKWRIAPMPVWPDGGHTTSTAGGTGFAVSKNSPHQDLAWDLLHYAYMTKEGQLKRYLEIHYFPTMKEVLKDSAVLDQKDPYYGGQQIGQVLAATADDAPVWYQSPFRSQQESDLNTQVTDFFSGKITADQAIDNTIKLTKESIAKNS